jgi:hypothetical protein
VQLLLYVSRLFLRNIEVSPAAIALIIATFILLIVSTINLGDPRARALDISQAIARETLRGLEAQTQEPEFNYPETNWELTWYNYSGDNSEPWNRADDYIGTTHVEEINFDLDWTDTEVANTGREDRVGFEARRTITTDRRRPTTIIIGGDDGIHLTILDKEDNATFKIPHGWKNQKYITYTEEMDLPAGKHRLLLKWYQNHGAARASINIRPEPS